MALVWVKCGFYPHHHLYFTLFEHPHSAFEGRKIVLEKYNCPSPETDIQCVLTLFSSLRDRQ